MVTKDEFVERLSKKGYTKRDAGVVMDDFIKTLTEKNDKIGFSFSTKEEEDEIKKKK